MKFFFYWIFFFLTVFSSVLHINSAKNITPNSSNTSLEISSPVKAFVKRYCYLKNKVEGVYNFDKTSEFLTKFNLI